MTGVRQQDVTKATAAAMVRAGWEQRGSGLFRLPGDHDVVGWASHLVSRGDDGAVEISPKVGVRDESLHQLVDRLSERDGGFEPTISIVLGYLLPEKSANMVWRFDGSVPIEEQAENLVQAVETYGRPFIESHSALEDLLDGLAADPWYGPKRYPAALALLGRRAEAGRALEIELAKVADRTDPRDVAAADLRNFALRLRAEIDGMST
jgi:hypothetical protein